MEWFIVFLLSIQIFGGSASVKQNLGGVWLLDEADGDYKGLKATVPGGIFTDLQNNKIIDDPFIENNDQLYKWVGRTNWTYYRNFTVDAELLSLGNINIVFEGLDTISSIFLNGKFLGNSTSMFLRYIFDVKDILKVGDNLIEVKFLSPVLVAEELALEQSQSYDVPPDCPPNIYGGECHVNQLRKMQASFSWDWGPSFASVGIWKDVYVEAFDSNVIRYVVVEMEENNLESEWNVSLTVYLSSNSLKKATGMLTIELTTDHSTKLNIYDNIDAPSNELDEVEFTTSFGVPQNAVRRWWPNGYGEQSLYSLNVTFTSVNETSSLVKRIGFRTVVLVQDALKSPDGKSSGNSFYFEVNGFPIFAKGSNAIPINILPERGQNKKSIDAVLRSAYDSHMNMLRVWGGGVYESDYYYQRADELGIMIWQDFMFACALYPTRTDYLRDVRAEVRHQVRRIGSHASIVIWAGNNENEAAITSNWYGSNGKAVYNDDYKKLYFDTIKPEFEKILKRGTFIGSSPSNGIKSDKDGGISKNPYDELYGDDHVYIYEMDAFNPNIYPVPRFSSEYGFQSYPATSTLLTATKNVSNLVIGSDFLKHRQHHPLGDIEIQLLIFYQLNLPDKKGSNYTDVFIFYSQVIQAMAIKIESEHYRKYRSIMREDGKGLTMGALYWQLNDVWVAPTWSGIDVTGKWKMLQYFVAKVFSPIIVLGHLNPDDSFEVTVVSDQTTTFPDVTLSISVYSWSSFVPVNVTEYNITVVASSSENVLSIQSDYFLQEVGCGGPKNASENCFFHLRLSKGGIDIAPENFVIPKSLKSVNLQYPDMKIDSIEKVDESDDKNYKITIKTTNIALFVWLDTQKIRGRFSDNGFHQITETKTVYFQSEEDISIEILNKYLTLSNILNVSKF